MTTTIDLFRNSMDTLEYQAGQVIFRVGEPGTTMYAVTEGEIDIQVGDDVVETVGPGGIFGELSIIDAAPRSATAVARTYAKVVPVSDKRFMFLVQQTPRFALQVMRIMSERLKRHDGQHTPHA